MGAGSPEVHKEDAYGQSRCKLAYASVHSKSPKQSSRSASTNFENQLPTYEKMGGRQARSDNVASSAFLRVCFEERKRLPDPIPFIAGVEQSMSTATRRGKLDLCPRRQCVRCHKTLNQQPWQPHGSPVIWQMRVWQRCRSNIWRRRNMLSGGSHRSNNPGTCCTHARPMCCRDQKAD